MACQDVSELCQGRGPGLCQGCVRTVSRPWARTVSRLCQDCVKAVGQDCARIVSGLCQGCVKTVSRLCQECVRNVSRLCQNCARNVSRLCQNCVKAVPGLCQGRMALARVGPGTIRHSGVKTSIRTTCVTMGLVSTLWGGLSSSQAAWAPPGGPSAPDLLCKFGLGSAPEKLA
eukprot:1152842-Pelagomonas_calceolata.AAC.10